MISNKPLPNPRTISLETAKAIERLRRNSPKPPKGHPFANLDPGSHQRPDLVVNNAFLFFAQFVDHDVSNSFPKPTTRYEIKFKIKVAFSKKKCYYWPNLLII